jgi:hypothetical protein
MTTFNAKPIAVEAVQYIRRAADMVFSDRPAWLDEALAKERGSLNALDFDGAELHAFTAEGPMCVDPGDWIVLGPEGDITVRSDGLFNAYYEPA